MAYRRLAPLDRNPTILYTESDVDDRHELAANDFVLLEDAKTKTGKSPVATLQATKLV